MKTRALLRIFVLLTFFVSCASAPRDRAPNPCIQGDCTDGSGTVQTEEGTYTGQFSNGLPQGEGRFEYADGRVYEGEFREGRWEGKGTLSGRGKVYTGSFVGNQRHGQGTEKEGDRIVYEGSWVNDKKDGPGTIHGTLSIEGAPPVPMLIHTHFKEDKRVGPDTVISGPYRWEYSPSMISPKNITGYYEDHQFYSIQINGQGFYTTPEGEKIEGEWQYGTLLNQEGKTYWILRGVVLAVAEEISDFFEPINIEATYIHPDGRRWKGTIPGLGDMNLEQAKAAYNLPEWLFYYAPTGM